MEERFSRTELLIGAEGLDKLAGCSVIIFGVGGVGGYAVEALARSGIGNITIVDSDTVAISNINRQIIATSETLGRPKVDVAEERIKSINPTCTVTKYRLFYLPENSGEFDFNKYDYIVDAIDTVSAKIDIIQKAVECGNPIISAMGCGNRLDPTKLTVTDISKTEMDPLAKIMRRELRNRGIRHLKVVYSTETPIKPAQAENAPGKKSTPGSTSFVPSVAGLFIAAEVVKDLIGDVLH